MRSPKLFERDTAQGPLFYSKASPSMRERGIAGRAYRLPSGHPMPKADALREHQLWIESHDTPAATRHDAPLRLSDLADRWLGSSDCATLADSTLKKYRHWIDRAVEALADPIAVEIQTGEVKLCYWKVRITAGLPDRQAAKRWKAWQALRARNQGWKGDGLHEALATATGVVSALSACFTWARGENLVHINPAERLNLERPDASPVIIADDVINAFVTDGEKIVLNSVADGVAILANSGQRPSDALQISEGLRRGEDLVLRQKKTGREIHIPYMGRVARRADMAAARQTERFGAPCDTVIATDTRGTQYSTDYFGSAFRTVRAEVEKRFPEAGELSPKHFRPTTMMRLFSAGCSLAEACSLTGHVIDHGAKILRHYYRSTGQLETTAAGRLDVELNRRGQAW